MAQDIRRSGKFAVWSGALAALAMGVQVPAQAFDIWGIDTSYKLTTTYGLSVRTRDPSPALINGAVDPFQSVVYPQPDQYNRQIGFTHTGLPTTINLDDGDRNLKKWDPVNNRLSAYYELQLHKDNYGAVFSGTAFYDLVFHQDTHRDAPDLNNPDDYGPNTLACSADISTCEYNKFNSGAKYYNGERSRMLEAYIYGDWYLSDSVALNVRLGKHLVAWGESLFFPGIVTGQGPNDATKAFIPGAEIKEILLPVNQISTTLAIGYNYSLMGYYQFDYKPTEVFPVGDFFSVADVVGPGAEMAYGSGNPGNASNCPGLFNIGLVDLSGICAVGGGVGGTLINANRTIDVPREKDIRPDAKGQYGVGFKAQVAEQTSLGLYYLHYHNHNPTVHLNFGYARIGDDPATGQEVTTEVINQPVPVSYQVEYFDNIKMYAGSWSTTLFGLNFAGDLMYRKGVDVSAAAYISGVDSPVFTRANTLQANISGLYVSNPNFLFYDEIVVVGETSFLHVGHVDKIPAFNGQVPLGDGKALFYDRDAWAYQFLILPKGRNLLPGWDIGTPISFAHAAHGYASTAGTFGALFGEGDMRVGLQVTAQYLQNLEFAVGFNKFLGNPRATVKQSPIPSNPVADRDYATFTIKYNL